MGFFNFFRRKSKNVIGCSCDLNNSNFKCDETETKTEAVICEINHEINEFSTCERDKERFDKIANRMNDTVEIVKKGYSVDQNKHIRVKDQDKVFTEGVYIIGVDIQPGEYYFWGDDVSAEIKGKEKYDIYGGFKECIDSYAIVEGNGKVLLENGYMTHIENIIYLYDVADKIIPGHVYRVGIEIPHGKYYLKYESRYDDGEQIAFLNDGECAFDMRECCDYGRIYRESGKEGIAITDELVKYVILYKGTAVLQEKGIFPTDSGPQTYHKEMKNYALTKKINEFREKKLHETSKIYKGNYVCFYFSVVEPMVEIILQNILLPREKCIIIPNLSEEDFAKNYVIMIDREDVDKQCIMMYLFMEKKIQAPVSFGISLSSLINSMQYNNLSGDRYEKAIKVIKEKISDDIMEVLKYYLKTYPYQVIDVPYYYVKYLPTDDEYKYLYYKVSQNREEYAKKYSDILLQLAEYGIISKKWKNEFNLYLMAKSYYIDAIYQYHDKFLDKQSLDIFIPSIDLGLEYQGIQHYEPVDFFGGDEGFEERKKLDSLKREKCLEKGILLIEWHYSKDVTDDNFVQMLEDNGLVVPEKKVIEWGHSRKEEIKDSLEEDKEVLFQYDCEGVFVNEFKSIDEAVEKTGINKVNIQRACSGFRTTAGGYQWRRGLVESLHKNIEPVLQKKSLGGKRAINQYDMDGNFIKQYESITAVSNENSINSKSIRDAANGKQRHAGGFVWKYVDAEL